jgi:MFS family permease
LITAQPSPGIGFVGFVRKAGSLVKLRDVAPMRRVMVVAIMVSMVVFLDGTVVNLALPATERDIGGGMCSQQWVVDGYLLAVAATVLPGGAISDLFGRIPVMRFGLVAFGAGSVLAATAGTPAVLIAGRLGPGVGRRVFGARLVGADQLGVRPRRPACGDRVLDGLDWHRLCAGAAAGGTDRGLTELAMPGPCERARVDVAGAALSGVGLAATVYALIESGRHGWDDSLRGALVVGSRHCWRSSGGSAAPHTHGAAGPVHGP